MNQPTANPVSLSSTAAITRLCDVLAVIALAVVGLVSALTFRDYGLGWDDYTHSQYGNLLVSLFSSGFTDKRALSFVNLYMYGGGFDILAALFAKILPFGLFGTRRLIGAAIGLVGLLVTWRLGRRLGGPFAGLAAVLLLASCPLYFGHMFINAKDGPFAVTSTIALLGIVRAFEEYPRATPATIALCGIGIGLAVGSRVMGGFAVVDAALPLLLVFAVRARADDLKAAFGECGLFLVAFIPGAVLAYLVMGLVWPWSVVEPLNPFHAVDYFSNFFEKPWRELFGGQLILVPDMPRSYVPALLALQLPGLFLGLGIGGLVGAIVCTCSAQTRVGYRAALLATLLAATLPILVTVAARPAMYNGIRHFVFTLPPLAALGGLAAAYVMRWLARRGNVALAAGALVAIAGIAAPVVAMTRLHPYEYTYFNRFAGGVAGARPRYMLDYWGLSLTQAARKLRTVIATQHLEPANGTWTVAVCGPHPPVAVALGPQFTTTWDPKDADFAISLGEFYCARLDAPMLFEIERAGVVYARVYDVRGRSIPSLLTIPGIDKQ